MAQSVHHESRLEDANHLGTGPSGNGPSSNEQKQSISEDQPANPNSTDYIKILDYNSADDVRQAMKLALSNNEEVQQKQDKNESERSKADDKEEKPFQHLQRKACGVFLIDSSPVAEPSEQANQSSSQKLVKEDRKEPHGNGLHISDSSPIAGPSGCGQPQQRATERSAGVKRAHSSAAGCSKRPRISVIDKMYEGKLANVAHFTMPREPQRSRRHR